MADDFMLIGDLGGTRARFAVTTRGAASFAAEMTMCCADFSTATAAVEAYLQQLGRGSPRRVCLAVAGVVSGGQVQFLNNHWQLDAARLARHLGSEQVCLINDFEAVARALPYFSAADLLPLGSPPPMLAGKRDFTVAVLGPGTGLGVSGLLQRDGYAMALAGEGGHGGFAPQSSLQLALLAQLQRRFGRVSNERLLSGPGVEQIYTAMRELQGLDPSPLTAQAIFAAAGGAPDAATDPVAVATVELFFEVLGQVAGDLALTLGARDGVFIAGGILRRYPDLLTSSAFRAGFENKGRHHALLASIPTALITHPQPGLHGAGAMVRQMAGQAA